MKPRRRVGVPRAPLSSKELVARLMTRWAQPEWVVLEEARSCVGHSGAERYADVLALSTYPSRGLRLVGCELKSSRSDVVRELRDPDKAEAIQRHCDRWYLVVGSKDLVDADEVPEAWGLMVPRGLGLRVAKEAPALEPEPWSREFVASLLRNAWKHKPADEALRRAWKEGFKHGEEVGKTGFRHVKEDLERLEANVKAFERASGVRIDAWLGSRRAAEQGAAFKAFTEAGIERQIDFARATAERFEAAARELRAIGGAEEVDEEPEVG